MIVYFDLLTNSTCRLFICLGYVCFVELNAGPGALSKVNWPTSKFQTTWDKQRCNSLELVQQNARWMLAATQFVNSGEILNQVNSLTFLRVGHSQMIKRLGGGGGWGNSPWNWVRVSRFQIWTITIPLHILFFFFGGGGCGKNGRLCDPPIYPNYSYILHKMQLETYQNT